MSERYTELWSRYEKDCYSLTPKEFEEMCKLSPYSREDGPDRCPECGMAEHSCSCGYFAQLEMEIDF